MLDSLSKKGHLLRFYTFFYKPLYKRKYRYIKVIKRVKKRNKCNREDLEVNYES
jgi:hypothetical protein